MKSLGMMMICLLPYHAPHEYPKVSTRKVGNILSEKDLKNSKIKLKNFEFIQDEIVGCQDQDRDWLYAKIIIKNEEHDTLLISLDENDPSKSRAISCKKLRKLVKE